MTFLFVVMSLQWVHLVSSIRALFQRLPLRAVANHMVLMCSMGAVLFGLFGIRLGAQGLGGANEAVWCFVLFGLGSALVSCAALARAIEQRGRRDPYGWRVGLPLVALMAALYLLGAVGDHFWFVRDGVTVVTDPGMLGVDDIPCEGVVLAHVQARGPSAYRCLRSLAWGAASAAPFIPWPTYTSGASDQLGPRIEAIKAEAIDVGTSKP